MNIQEAKTEVKNTVRAYLKKDEAGLSAIPVEKQRPLLLIGPPGIGKTAIMEQIARELGIGLVSYTITHHTRQSAIGLPYISHRNYGGKDTAVTEYTMSEIIASVYEEIERTGNEEGILFLDEINCVSETLAPTMLQFLQYKTFGAHRVPDGYVIVTAGNPPQYNKSVRDLDIVTLDRVRRLDIEEDYKTWKDYARRNGVHGAILAYLEIRRDHFYHVRTEIEERYFVTARGWEDLSRILKVYEDENIPVTAALVREYLQDPEIASSFADYYLLYRKYSGEYRIADILGGIYPEETAALRNAPFDEKLSLIGLLTDALSTEGRDYCEKKEIQTTLQTWLSELRMRLKNGEAQPAAEILDALIGEQKSALKRDTEAKHLSREDQRIRSRAIRALEEMKRELPLSSGEEGDEAGRLFMGLRDAFLAREKERMEDAERTSAAITNSFSFMARTFGEGQEMVMFLSELTGCESVMKHIADLGNEAYERYSRLLLLKERKEGIREDILAVRSW